MEQRKQFRKYVLHAIQNLQNQNGNTSIKEIESKLIDEKKMGHNKRSDLQTIVEKLFAENLIVPYNPPKHPISFKFVLKGNQHHQPNHQIIIVRSLRQKMLSVIRVLVEKDGFSSLKMIENYLTDQGETISAAYHDRIKSVMKNLFDEQIIVPRRENGRKSAAIQFKLNDRTEMHSNSNENLENKSEKKSQKRSKGMTFRLPVKKKKKNSTKNRAPVSDVSGDQGNERADDAMDDDEQEDHNDDSWAL